MGRLYELFGAEWLKAWLPAHVFLKAKEQVNIGLSSTLHFDIDLVLYDPVAGNAHTVLDTKQKTPERPGPDDIAQAIAYAQAGGCTDTVLIYPTPLCEPLGEKVGDVRVRSFMFCLDADLEKAGRRLITHLLDDNDIRY